MQPTETEGKAFDRVGNIGLHPVSTLACRFGTFQEASSHADLRTTMRYDRGRGPLDRHATYIVATFLAGAER